ncbi:MAG: PepSY-like domain-containing protein [Cyclobacteriaceae bacterium]|nr:PepSY-like domain-containing protein [Cyclobacteriaceae bacterium]
MKIRLLAVVVLLGIFSMAKAQVQKIEQKDVPRVVYKAHGYKYPAARNIEWTVPDCDCYEDWEAEWEESLELQNLREGDQPKFFHVTYKYENKDRRSIYYRDGEWMETRTVFSKDDLPAKVGTAIAATGFGNWKLGKKIVYVLKSTDDGGAEAFYKVPVKDGLNKETLKVDPDGNIIPNSTFQAGMVDKDQVPKVVYKSFGTKYPFADKVEWYLPDCDCYDDWKNEWESAMIEPTGKKIEDPDNFYVRFQYKDKTQRSVFYRNGEWMETEIILNTKDLPDLILDAVKNSEYSDWKMADQVVLMERPLADGSVEAIYTVTVKGGLKKRNLKVFADGTLVPKKKLLSGEN